ncbi:hypothetical protein C8R44DRAFT_419752 [Mycena epipterygia]|nr:hypothetical protein C8R44DRAFT_419752 [Mycena epipterygia]
MGFFCISLSLVHTGHSLVYPEYERARLRAVAVQIQLQPVKFNLRGNSAVLSEVYGTLNVVCEFALLLMCHLTERVRSSKLGRFRGGARDCEEHLNPARRKKIQMKLGPNEFWKSRFKQI